jgi:hypothetical protein
MGFRRKIRICAIALAGIGLGTASTAGAQRCQHIGMWSLVNGHYVCSGDTSGQCLWYDDCRVNAD